MWDSANYCNQHQPDFLPGGTADNTCGSATINGSHISPYEQCTLGGGSCQQYKGGWVVGPAAWQATDVQDHMWHRPPRAEPKQWRQNPLFYLQRAAGFAGGTANGGMSRGGACTLSLTSVLPPGVSAGGQGEFTDYYLYITAIQDDHCASGAVAWALPCLYDDTTNRPLLGSANICPDALMNGDADSSVPVLVHELTHALGFTDDMFDKFVDADGQPVPENQVGLAGWWGLPGA